MLLGAVSISALTFGCHSEPQRLLGASFKEAPPTAIQTLSSNTSPTPVIVQGEMIEKCPVAGCWFMLKDKTGVVRVDTKNAGFVISEVPLHTRMTVAGTVTHSGQPGIAASGVRY